MRLLSVGIDAMDRTLVDEMIGRGELPHLAAMMSRGARADLEGKDRWYRNETAWTVFATGKRPTTTGFWSPIVYDAATMTCREPGAYDYWDHPPVWALGPDTPVCIIDMPQYRLHPDVEGVQIMGWGSHSQQGPSESWPPELLDEVTALYGPHPANRNDTVNPYDEAAVAWLHEALIVGLERRVAIARDLWGRREWSWMHVQLAEPHSGAHSLWHHGLAHPMGRPGERVQAIYRAVDEAVGEMMSWLGPDDRGAALTVHGMRPNVPDTATMTLLPEALHRWNFPGKQAIRGRIPEDAVPLRHAKWEVWDLVDPQAGLEGPASLIARGHPLNWQPATWWEPLWPKMKAFVLPSYSEGTVRIGVRGRDAQGIVAPEDYDAVIGSVSAWILGLRSLDGREVVEDIERTRVDPLDPDPKLPDADLVVHWRPEAPFNGLRCPDGSTIGPVPWFRTGGHTYDGFLILEGAGVEPGGRLREGHPVDVPATLLAALGREVPGIDGQSLWDPPQRQQAKR